MALNAASSCQLPRLFYSPPTKKKTHGA